MLLRPRQKGSTISGNESEGCKVRPKGLTLSADMPVREKHVRYPFSLPTFSLAKITHLHLLRTNLSVDQLVNWSTGQLVETER
jgi:hypothetical protein